MKKEFCLKYFLVFLLAFVVYSQKVFADDIVKMGAPIEIKKGEIFEGNAVSLFSDIEIEGALTGNAVAVFGNVRLGEDALVGRDTVSIGGEVICNTDSQVKGRIHQLRLHKLLLVLLPTLGTLACVSIFYQLFFSLAVLALIMLIAIIFPKTLEKAAAKLEHSPFKSFFAGILALAGLPLVIFILIVTLIGIIFIPLLFVLIACASVFGYAACALLIGRRILEAFGQKDKPAFLSVLVAGVLFGLVSAVPLVGLLLLSLGLGASLLSRFGLRQ
jgi:hypothetical protein